MKKTDFETVITCPSCGHKQKERLSKVDCCSFSFVCGNCKKVLKPQKDGLCVLCNYSPIKCPDYNPETGECSCCKMP